jgi:soluble P-type ATPase
LNELFPRVGEIPFDSDRKLMTTINKLDDHYIVIVKGAFDMMAPRCISGNIEKAKQVTESMSAEALRVLAIGYKEINEVPDELTSEDLENGLSLMGLVGMIDPPRPEAKVAVSTCRRAGIKPVMITGDHVVTATAIAKELDIYRDGDKSITGAQLDAMTDSELDDTVEKISVYARVSPENKIRIVKAWQRKGQVVSMTGDGVNDAPALKAADIGCAMGITGTDVAKSAADMTLTDDNFSTIVDAVREGCALTVGKTEHEQLDQLPPPPALGVELAFGNPRQGRKLDGAHDTAQVVRMDLLCALGIELAQSCVKALGASLGLGLGVKLRAKRLVRPRGIRMSVTPQSLEIKPRAAADDRNGSSGKDLRDRLSCHLAVLSGGKADAGIDDVDQMVRDPLPLLCRGLGSPDVKTAVDLHRIAGDDLAAEAMCKSKGEVAFARGGRSDNGDRPHRITSER